MHANRAGELSSAMPTQSKLGTEAQTVDDCRTSEQSNKGTDAAIQRHFQTLIAGKYLEGARRWTDRENAKMRFFGR